MDNRKKMRNLTWTAMFIAIVTVATYTLRFPIVATGGYVNLGDTMIFVAALVGGPQMGLIAGGVGSALADLISGYAHWAPWTLVIKGIEGSLVGVIAYRSYRRQGPLAVRTLIGLAVAALWMVAGYYVAGGLMRGFPAALTGVPGDLVQGFGSLLIAIPVLGAVRRLKLYGDDD